MSTVPINPRARAASAVQLRSAREDAGLTFEQVAGRIVDAWDARLGNGRRASWHETVVWAANRLRYLESASHGAWERAESWWHANRVYAAGGPDRRVGRAPRADLHLWREAIAAIRGDDYTVVEEALTAAHETVAAKDRAREFAREHGRDIATLVWNAAEDPSFLDRALVHELQAVTPQFLSLMVRETLVDIAHELRVTFPDRPERELRSAA